MTKYGKAFLALTLGLSMVGCSKAPTNVAPENPSVRPGVVSPGNVLNPSTNDGTCVPPVVTPVVAPLPLCNFLAFTAFIGCHDKLFLYDDILKDNYALVGAGEDINNPQYFDGGKIVYDRCGKILVYDILTETNCYLTDVNSVGYVHRPSMDWLGDKMVFLDYCGRAYLWCCNPCISVCELAKINALGPINWISISADGLWAVFTTCDGCLYTYNICNPMICLIADARSVCSRSRCDDGCSFDEDLAFITQPAISATGRQIAFTAVNFDRRHCRPETSIWRYDRVLDCLDPMPFANAALNNCLAVDPMFKCYDEENIYYEAFVPGFRVDIDWKLYTKAEDLAKPVGDMLQLICMLHNRSFAEGMDVLQQPDGYHPTDPFQRMVRCITDGMHEALCDRDQVYGCIRAENILEGYRVLDYNWLTEMVRTLTIVNNVHGDTETLISDPDLFCGCDFRDDRGGCYDGRGGYYDQNGRRQ